LVFEKKYQLKKVANDKIQKIELRRKRKNIFISKKRF